METSACIITLNEEENIRECLESISWCDEIVLVDSYSDDDTVDIAKEYADKILFEERRSDFDNIREKAIQNASGEWIIQIDADERMPESLSKRIREIISEDSADVIRAPRKNYKFGEWIKERDLWPDHTYCAYKKEVVDVTGQLHDFLQFTKTARKIDIRAKEEYALSHQVFDSIFEHISKVNRYTEEESAKNASLIRMFLAVQYTFGRKLFYCGLWRYGRLGIIIALLNANATFIKYLKSIEVNGRSLK